MIFRFDEWREKMTDYHCDYCEFFEDKSTGKLIDGYCKKYNQSLDFYDWWEQCNECIIDTLQTENATLRERLEKAVELPCIEPMTTWDWDNETGIGESHFGDRYQLLYRDKDGEFIAYVGLDKEEAEARLAELKGGKK